MFSDTYISSSSLENIKCFCDTFANVIGPRSGMAAVAEETLEDGSVILAQAAIGDPLRYYACIRTAEILSLPEGIEHCNESEGSAVLGVWA